MSSEKAARLIHRACAARTPSLRYHTHIRMGCASPITTADFITGSGRGFLRGRPHFSFQWKDGHRSCWYGRNGRRSRTLHLGHDDLGLCWDWLHGLSPLAQEHTGIHCGLIKSNSRILRPPSGGLFVYRKSHRAKSGALGNCATRPLGYCW